MMQLTGVENTWQLSNCFRNNKGLPLVSDFSLKVYWSSKINSWYKLGPWLSPLHQNLPWPNSEPEKVTGSKTKRLEVSRGIE